MAEFLEKWKSGLAKTSKTAFGQLATLLGATEITSQTWEDLEALLIQARLVIERLPERGDHEESTFPELAAEQKLRAWRHEGTWITVNTPKDLRRAEDFFAAHPEWRPRRVAA